MRFAWCGDDQFVGALQRLVDEGHELHEVYVDLLKGSVDDAAGILRVAAACGACVQFAPVSRASLEHIARGGVAILVSAAYPNRVPDWRGTVRYAVNVHPTLLPEKRGPFPLPWVILERDILTGVTLHKLSSEWDAGDIVGQIAYPVAEDDTLDTLAAQAQIAAASLLRKLFRAPEPLWRDAVPQSGGSWRRRPPAALRRIEWTEAHEDLTRRCRAFGKIGLTAEIGGTVYAIRDLRTWIADHRYPPGTLVLRTRWELVVATGAGYACIRFWSPVGSAAAG